MTIRKPAVAGGFYPADPAALKQAVEGFLQTASAKDLPLPKVIVAPHAGYQYSGTVAGEAYAPLQKNAEQIRRVVLLGPSHKVAFDGLAFPLWQQFETPLGRMPVNSGMSDLFYNTPFVRRDDEPHRAEHSLEVQIPFLQYLLPQAELVPLVVGRASPEQVAEVLEQLWGGPETLIVISTDLSHYENYETASAMDTATSQAILQKSAALTPKDACGSRPLNGLLHIAARLGLEGRQVALCNSGDTAGAHNRGRVVGYGAYHFGALDMQDIRYDPEHKQALLTLARDSIRHGLEHGAVMPRFSFPTHYHNRIPQASFVTLKKDGRLRGCVGSLQAHQPLALDVMRNAYKAAFADKRFQPLMAREWDDIRLSLSLLTPPQPMRFGSEADALAQITPGVDGLILEDAGRRGTFLPSVWESFPEPELFLRHLKRKAGLPENHWSPQVKLWRYRADYAEEDQLH